MSQFTLFNSGPPFAQMRSILIALRQQKKDYASVIFVGFGGGAAVWYWIWGRKTFSRTGGKSFPVNIGVVF
jgi:hypothetical protein